MTEQECPECHGQRGFYVMPNGNRYHNNEEGSEWQGCENCEASGTVDSNTEEES